MMSGPRTAAFGFKGELPLLPWLPSCKLEFQSNFLDSLSDDLPNGCWAVRQEQGGASTMREVTTLVALEGA